MKKSIYLVISSLFPTAENFRGGYVLDQVRAIARNSGYEVVVLKPVRREQSGDYSIDGIRVYTLNRYDIPSNILPQLFDFLNGRLLLKKLSQIGIEISSVSYVHGHCTENGIYLNLLKRYNPNIKTILQHHGLDVLQLDNGFLKNSDWHKKLLKGRGVKICNQVDLHVGVSQLTLSQLILYPECFPKDTYVLYNGVDRKKFYRLSRREASPNFFTIGCIANFWPLKDQLTLLKAALNLIEQALLPNIRLLLIGSGPTLEECKRFVHKHKMEQYVSFMKEVPHHKLNEFYNQLNLFVLPSYYEALGCVYLEAFACGVPFIAVQGMGISELLPSTEKKRWLIKKGDANSLSKLIYNYAVKPSEQALNQEIDIDVLIKDFLFYIKR